MGQLTQTFDEVQEALRLQLEPAHLAFQLPESESPIVTPITSASTPTKALGADQVLLIDNRDFTYDVANDRFYFSRAGAVDVPFVINNPFCFSQNASTAEVIARVNVSGSPVDGVYIKRTIGNANTVGSVTIGGHISLSENDYIELMIESDKTGDFNMWSLEFDMIEGAEYSA